MGEDEHEVVGFIDIGTNSIHTLVVRFFDDLMGTEVFQDKEMVRLGQSLFTDGRIDRGTIRKTKLVVSKFAEVSRNMGASKVLAFATCAAREASNREELIEALSDVGVDVKVISGVEEARLIRLGIFGPVAPDRNSLAIDIGGGSTEVVVCNGADDLYLDSIRVGTIRLAYGVGMDQSEGISSDDYDNLRRMVNVASYRTRRHVGTIGFERAYGSSGTMISLAEMCAAKRDGDSSYMTYDELSSLMREIYPMNVDERLRIPGMNPSRGDIIVSGGAIAEELMRTLGIGRIEISRNGLKQGMEADYRMGIGHSNFNVKESSVMSLAKRCGYSEAHCENVKGSALQMFDGLRECGIHDMGKDMRELLSYAAVLHDIGEFINYDKHNMHSYRIIRDSALKGFDNDELCMMALMAKFHQNKFPSKGVEQLKGLTKTETRDVIRCSMMLKVAEILDRGHCGSVNKVTVKRLDGRICLNVHASKDISMEIWKLNAIHEDFSWVFGVDFIVRAQMD